MSKNQEKFNIKVEVQMAFSKSCCNFYVFQTFFRNLYYIHRRTIKLIDKMPKSIPKQLANINIDIEE